MSASEPTEPKVAETKPEVPEVCGLDPSFRHRKNDEIVPPFRRFTAQLNYNALWGDKSLM